MYVLNVVIAAVVALSLISSAWTLRHQRAASGGTKHRVLAPLTLVVAVLALALLVVRIIGY